MPMVRAPPGRFSTTTGWPSALESSGASMRATVSVALPGAWGTTSLTARSGNWAAAPVASASARHAARNLLDRAKYLPDDVAAGLDRVLADFLFFFGHHVKKAIERLLRHVFVQVGLFLLYQAKLHALLRVLVVLLGKFHLRGGFFHHRQEPLAQLVGGAALEIFRARGLAAGEDALGVLHAHFLHRIDEQLLRLGYGRLGGPVHGQHEFVGVLAHADAVHELLVLFQRIGQRDLHRAVAEKAVSPAQQVDRDHGAFFQRPLEAGDRVLVAEGVDIRLRGNRPAEREGCSQCRKRSNDSWIHVCASLMPAASLSGKFVAGERRNSRTTCAAPDAKSLTPVDMRRWHEGCRYVLGGPPRGRVSV